MRLLGNIIWVIFGGFEMAVGWLLAGLVMVVTIIGIPWARSCFTIALLALWPFGRRAVNRRDAGVDDLGTGPLGLLGNIVWFVLGGWWLALGHLFMGLLFFITIIGIPFGMQHMKLARLSLAPVGMDIENAPGAGPCDR
jgi:uncharacterized membrane protein YccF (DUF307 family)